MEQLLEREKTEQLADPVQARRPSRFRKGFWIYLAVLAGLILIGLALLWAALARYQAGVDAEAAAQAALAAQAEERAADRAALQAALLDFVADSGPEVWAAYYMASPRLETRAGVEAQLGQLLNGHSLESYKAEGWSPEQPVYSIYLGEQSFARITMERRSGAWQPGQVELLLQGEQVGSITVPEGTVLRCGDVVLEADRYAGPVQLMCPPGPEQSALREPVYGRTYTVSGLLAPPEFVLEQAPEHVAAFDGGYAPALAPEQSGAYQSQADALVQALVYYYFRGKDNCKENMLRAANLTVPDSQAHRTITGSYDGVIWTQCFYQDYSCETQPGQVLVWAENCYSVDVHCKAYGAGWESEKTMDGAYRVFFTDAGDGFGITCLETL